MLMNQEKMPFVRFESRARINGIRSQEAGRPCFDDVDFIVIMQPGSRDEYEKEALEWFEQKKREAANGSYNPDWLDKFKAKYDAYKKGQELPPDGTPIQLLAFLTPAEIAQLKAMNIHTLEDGCEMNEQAIGSVGMNGRNLRDRFRAYRDSITDASKMAADLARIKADLETAQKTILEQNLKINELKQNQQAKK